jgi:hypothetical protein
MTATNANSDGALAIKRGDFVRAKHGVGSPIGVVWAIHPANVASVEVYYPVNGKTVKPTEHKPEELVIVPPREVTRYLVEFKATMDR